MMHTMSFCVLGLLLGIDIVGVPREKRVLPNDLKVYCSGGPVVGLCHHMLCLVWHCYR